MGDVVDIRGKLPTNLHNIKERVAKCPHCGDELFFFVHVPELSVHALICQGCYEPVGYGDMMPTEED